MPQKHGLAYYAGVSAVTAAACWAGALFLHAKAAAGPAQATGLPRLYYNWAYARTACPSAPLEKYEDENISFSNYSAKDLPRVEIHTGFSFGEVQSPAETIRYTQIAPYSRGNTDICRYAPNGRQAAGEAELRTFVSKYAELYIGPEPKIEFGIVPGAPFSARFTSASREGICFTDKRGILYCFRDPDMPMQQGYFPLGPTLRYSLGLATFSLDDNATYGMKDWLTRPAREKRAECNFMEIKNTLKVGKQ